MGPVLHGSTHTTAAVRRTNPTESRKPDYSGQMSRDYLPKTVAKWKRRMSANDLPTGLQKSKSTTSSIEEKAIIVAFRRHTLLPLDDCLYALQASTRSPKKVRKVKDENPSVK